MLPVIYVSAHLELGGTGLLFVLVPIAIACTLGLVGLARRFIGRGAAHPQLTGDRIQRFRRFGLRLKLLLLRALVRAGPFHLKKKRTSGVNYDDVGQASGRVLGERAEGTADLVEDRHVV